MVILFNISCYNSENKKTKNNQIIGPLLTDEFAMKKISSKYCQVCNKVFIPLPQHPNQKYCTDVLCKKERKASWTKYKMRVDPDYREAQASASKKWSAQHPDYQRNYRKNKAKFNENIDSLNSQKPNNYYLKSANYKITILEYNENMDSLIVKLDFISDS